LSKEAPSETTAEHPVATPDSRLLLPISDAAQMLGVSKMTVRRRIRAKVWPSGRCGSKHLLPRAFVEGAVAAVGRGIDIETFAQTWFEQAEAVA
jgi:excisionase family DNA binding protein